MNTTINATETERIARIWFESLYRGDFETAFSYLAEDVEWINAPKTAGVSDMIPWLGTWHGIKEVRNSFRFRNEAIEPIAFKPGDIVVQGNIAICTIFDSAKVKATGITYETTFASWVTIENGKITKWQWFCDPCAIIYAFRGDMRARMFEAIQINDTDTVANLIKWGASPNVRDWDTGITPLMLAACHGNAAIVRQLLAAGADPMAVDSKTGATALHKACQGGSVECVRLLIDAGCFVDCVAPTTGHTPIIEALWYKWPQIVSLLADRGANLNIVTHYGFTWTDRFNREMNLNAADKNMLGEINKIWEARKAEDKSAIDRQPIMAALIAKNPAKALELIQQGAKDVNAIYPIVNSWFDGHTPLHIASREGYTEVVDALIKAGAKTNAEDWVFKGWPIHEAAYNGNADILSIMVQTPGIDINIQGPINGYTPLHGAIWHGYADCAKILIEAGARLDIIGHDGKSVIDIAIATWGENGEITNIIRKRGGAEWQHNTSIRKAA